MPPILPTSPLSPQSLTPNCPYGFCHADSSPNRHYAGNCWQRAKLRVGYGHLYQGRFKSFPIETDEHFYRVARYVERNALRAGLVQRAEDWKWGSLQQRARKSRGPLLAEWPLPEPSDWIEQVNLPQTETELEAIRRCLHRGSPYGKATWTEQVAEQLGLQSTLRGRDRPHKSPS